MSALSIYSNHAGTLSESFAIGKRGIQLLQGTADPTGLTAPTGSLYLLKASGVNKVYQIDSSGNWTALLSPSDIIPGTGITVTELNGTVTINRTATKYKTQFANSDLTAGALTVSHNLIEDYPVVMVYNNSRQFVVPDGITSNNANSVTIDLTSYGPISGNWNVIVVSE